MILKLTMIKGCIAIYIDNVFFMLNNQKLIKPINGKKRLQELVLPFG